jgi:hypothetical protein
LLTICNPSYIRKQNRFGSICKGSKELADGNSEQKISHKLLRAVWLRAKRGCEIARLDRSPKKASIIIVILLAVVLSASFPNRVHAQSAPIVGVWSTQYNSANITDTSLVANSKFNVQINVTGAPLSGWNSYELVLYYDQRYITVSSYDTSTNTIFGQSAHEGPGTFNGPGALRLSVVDLGVAFADSGTLVNIEFTVVSAGGVSPLTLAAGMAQTGTGVGPSANNCQGCPPGAPNWTRLTSGNNLIGVETADGYFKNIGGTSGPKAHFTFTPTNPIKGDTVTFNATESFDPDVSNTTANHGIANYIWDFGDISDNSFLNTTSAIVTHDFKHGGTGGTEFAGNFSILLRVQDADQNLMGMEAQLITISLPPSHCVQVSGIFAKSQITTGLTESVTVQLTDSGTYTERFNMTVMYGPPSATVGQLTDQSIAPSKIVSYPGFNISTTNLDPAVYNIVVIVTLYGSQNCAAGTFQTQFAVNPPILGTNVLLLVGGVVVFVASIVVLTLLARRRKRPEPP